MPFAKASDGARIYYEAHGEGPGLLLGHPVFASSEKIPFGVPANGYRERLTDRYRVVTVDYPGGLGRSDAIAPEKLTAARVSDDLLAVADAAGLDRFCWWGFSWGGGVGLQLATRTDRVAVLVCGGYAPLGEFHLSYVNALRAMMSADVAGYVAFYESLADWPEAEAIARISCPRLLFFGSDDEFVQSGITVRIAATVRRYRDTLVDLGWQVVEVAGRDHSLGWDLVVVVPLVREFLDTVPPWR